MSADLKAPAGLNLKLDQKAGPPVVAQITIMMDAHGEIATTVQGAAPISRQLILMMCETAKVDLERAIFSQEQAAIEKRGKVMMPPPSMSAINLTEMPEHK